VGGLSGSAGAALIAAAFVAGGAYAQSAAPAGSQSVSAPVATPSDPAPVRASAPVVQEAAAPTLSTAKVAPATKPEVVETKPAEPAKRPRSSVAIIQALDKVTTETMRFEAPVGQPIRYKTLIFTVRACETSAADEIAPVTAAYVVVDTQPKAVSGRIAPAGRQIYKGWMYANAPGVHPLEHPVYDAWLIACKASSPEAPVVKR